MCKNTVLEQSFFCTKRSRPIISAQNNNQKTDMFPTEILIYKGSGNLRWKGNQISNKILKNPLSFEIMADFHVLTNEMDGLDNAQLAPFCIPLPFACLLLTHIIS